MRRSGAPDFAHGLELAFALGRRRSPSWKEIMRERWRGKLRGPHSTVIEAAWRFLPQILRDPSVTGISPGFITAGKRASGRNSIKIIEEGSWLLLSVRGSTAHQELRVFTSDAQTAKLAVARAARKASFHVSFGSGTIVTEME